jgi:hypothetical protein
MHIVYKLCIICGADRVRFPDRRYSPDEKRNAMGDFFQIILAFLSSELSEASFLEEKVGFCYEK